MKGDTAYITQNMDHCATFRDRRQTVQDKDTLILKGFAAIHYAIALNNFEIFQILLPAEYFTLTKITQNI